MIGDAAFDMIDSIFDKRETEDWNSQSHYLPGLATYWRNSISLLYCSNPRLGCTVLPSACNSSFCSTWLLYYIFETLYHFRRDHVY